MENRKALVEEWYRSNYKKCLGWVTKRVDRPEDAEEIMQLTALRLLLMQREWGSINKRIAILNAKDIVQDENRILYSSSSLNDEESFGLEEQILSQQEDPETSLEKRLKLEEFSELLDECFAELNKIKPVYRNNAQSKKTVSKTQIFKMKFLENRTYEYISEKLGITPKSAKQIGYTTSKFIKNYIRTRSSNNV